MSAELIIIAVFAVLGIYVVIQTNLTNKKTKSKSTSKKNNDDSKKQEVELKTVVGPKATEEQRKKQAGKNRAEIMKKAALDSIEYEKTWKQSLKEKQEQEDKGKQQKEQTKLDKKLEEMQEKLDQIDFSVEEQSFVDEVNELSPELKAVLFADLLSRKGF